MKVIRRQVRRPARPFQVEISSVSSLDVISAKSLQIDIYLMYLLLGDRRQVRRQTRPLQVEISLQKRFLALISEVLIDGNKLVIAALSQIDVEKIVLSNSDDSSPGVQGTSDGRGGAQPGFSNSA